MDIKSLINFLKPKGEYSKTDMTNYTELSPSKIRAALLTKEQNELFPIFTLIEDKDSSVGAEIEKRISSLENKYFTSKLSGENENIEEIIKASVEARIFGFSILEFYLKDDLSLGISKVDRKFIGIKENEASLKIKNREFTPKEPNFIIIKSKPVLLKIIWIVFAKHFVLSHYLKFVEFLGVPPLVGNSSNGDEKVISLMAEALQNLKSGSYAVLGPADIVKVLEGRGSQDDFMEFVKYCDAEIAKVINGSVLSSNISVSGSYAMSKTHEDNRKEILAADAKFAIKCVNEIYAKLGKKPDLNIQIEKDFDLLQRAQVLQILGSLGYEMSPIDMAKEFDLPLPKDNSKEKSLNSKQKSYFLDEFDKTASKISTKKEELEIEKVVSDILSECESFDEAYEKIANLYPNLSLEEVEKHLSKLIANSYIKGLL